MVEFLIQNSQKFSIDLNLKNVHGRTPFHLACYFGKLQNAEVILKNSKKHSIRVFATNNQGLDGQTIAQQQGHQEVADMIKHWKFLGLSKNRLRDRVLLDLEEIRNLGVSLQQSRILSRVIDTLKKTEWKKK